MKLGDKVIVVKQPEALNMLVGQTGTIVGEKMPTSQFAILTGKTETRWIVKFDNPIVVSHEQVEGSVFAESMLAITEANEHVV